MNYETANESLELAGFQLRSATELDAEAMVLLTKQAVASRKGEPIPIGIRDASEVDDTRERLGDPTTWSRLVIDEVSGELAGLALGYPENDPETVGDLENKEHLSLLMVSPDYQKRGIGSFLLDWMSSELSQRGVTNVYLWTEVNNHLSIPFYENRGWRLTWATRYHPKHGDPQVQYVLDLGST